MDEIVNYQSFYHPLSLKKISFKNSKIYKQEFEKSLHNFKENIYN